MTRLASIGLGAILLFLTGFAVWAAATSKKSADHVKRSSVLADGYRRAQYALAVEDRQMSEYLVKFVPGAKPFHKGQELRTRHEEAADQLIDAMQSVRLNGSDADRALANKVLAEHRDHMEAAMRLFEAADEGDVRRALEIQHKHLDPGFSHIQTTVVAAAVKHRQESLRRLRALTHAEDVVFTGTLIAFTVGLLLLAALVAVLRASARRVEEARQAEFARLERVALTDNLTELRNHRAFHEDLAREVERTERSRLPLSLVILDLDGLKKVNDIHGHQSGDEQLQAVASCLKKTLRGGDTAYRIGGDECAVILAGEMAWGAFRFMQRVHANLALIFSTNRPSVTAGVAQLNGAMSKDALVRHADLALIEAKRSRQQSLMYTNGLEPRTVDPDEAVEQHHRVTLTTALARAVDAKDSYTRSHSETVSQVCALIAEELGLGPERVAKLRLAGLLHDVGKIGISDEILRKPGTLTANEFEVMKSHSSLGHSIVSAAELYEEAEWILHHHERPDGLGYPNGLRDDEIPLESRIILVSDAFEAITSDRPYRKGQTESEAFLELERNSRTQFDPNCVAALRRALERQASGLAGLLAESEYEEVA